ncbi:MAG TPA: hypothetical protein VH702_11525 [Vicinamibacterales bacterium]
MVRVFTGTLAAAVLGAVTMVGAQAPAAPPQAPPKPADQVDRAQPQTSAKTQTITGCVEKGSGADSFVLAESSAAAAPAPGAKPGEKPAGTTGATKSYALMAKPTEDLSKHVNHKIEVTGTVSAAPSAAPGSPKEVLNVQSIKMVAATCQ